MATLKIEYAATLMIHGIEVQFAENSLYGIVF